MSKNTVCKEGDLVLLVSNTHNKDNHDESYSTITGIISYISDSRIGFECATKHTIYKNGSTYFNMSHNFNVSRDYAMITILKRHELQETDYWDGDESDNFLQ